MNKKLKEIIYCGTSKEMSLADRRNLRLVNSFILLSSVLAFLIFSVELVLAIWSRASLALGAILLIFLPSLYLNYARKYKIARFYFFFWTSSLIFFAALLGIYEGRSTGTENLLIAVAVATLVLFSGKWKLPLFVLIVLELFTVHYVRYLAFDQSHFSDYPLTVMNYIVVFVAIYFFYDRYQKEHSKSHTKTVELNKQLSIEKENVSRTQKILYSMIDHLPLIICMIDREGRFLSMNRLFARDYGFEVRDMVGKNYQEVMPKYFVEQQGVYIERCLSGEKVKFDEKFELPFQKPVNAYGSCIPIHNKKGEVVATTFFAANVNEMKDKEHQLEVLNETKNKLFSIIAHDLRSPINLINGLVFMNKDEEVTENERIEHADRVDRALKNLTGMLENLLMWARHQLEGHEDTLDYYNLKHLVNEEISLYDEMLEAKKIRVSVDIPDDQQVYTSESALRMIVRNIYTNAVKFSDEQGIIEVYSEVEDDHVELVIHDSGVGMSEEWIRAIEAGKFIKSQTGTEGEKGAGIGLHLALQLLDEVGGSYRLESGEGKGTIFKIRLASVYKPERVYA